VLVFYALEQGTVFAARAAQATVAGLIGTALFAFAYGRYAGRFAWYWCVVIGWLAFAVTIAVLYVLRLQLLASMAMLVGAAMGARGLLPFEEVKPASLPVPPGDLAVRMVTSAALVVALTALASWLGPRWSGLLSAFPVLTTIIVVFTHHQHGGDAAVVFLREYLQAVIGFGLFCATLSVALTQFGLLWALVLALASQLATQAYMLRRVTGNRERRPASIRL
jgi:hypothetical protein